MKLNAPVFPPRPEILAVAREAHGAARLRELRAYGRTLDQVLDFSVNVNPFGPSPEVYRALSTARIDRYPDAEALLLKEALAEHHQVDVNCILVGNGVSELLLLIALAFIRPRDRALILEPTYGEYRRYTLLMGGNVHTWRSRPEEGFRVSWEDAEKWLRESPCHVVWLCHPNNPTGHPLPLETLASWAEAHSQTLFVVDEAYINFVPSLPSAVSLSQPNILVLRSMTKDYALPGLRLGYAVGHPDIIRALAQVQPPWSVNALAQVAGLAALQDQHHLQQTIQQTLAAKEALVAELQAMGWKVLAAAPPFFLMHVGNASRFRERLLQEGILVRDGTSFGLPAYVRIGTRRPEENAQLVQVLRQLRHEFTG